MDEMDLSQFKDVFVAEAKENLAALSLAVVELEKNPQNKENLKDIFRVAHTLKGMSATMGYEKIVKVTHHMEDVFDKLRKGEVPVKSNIVDVIFECLDNLERLVREVETGAEEKIGWEPLIDRLNELLVVEDAGSHERETEIRKPEIRNQSSEASAHAALPPAERPVSETASAATAVIEKEQKHKTANIRVNISYLDAIMNLVGEMVISKSQLEQIAAKHKIEELLKTIQQFDRIAIDLQEAVLKTRMVPVSQIFDRYPRMVRDLAKKLNKEIDFEIRGADIEIDRMLLDEINEPLVHLLRNALDHGIEDAGVRQSRGKPPKGSVILSARRERGQISIEVSDDGKGLDPEVLRKKAVERNIISEEEARQLSDDDAYLLVCDPRFSTADKITDISGRGVGMDVVKTLVEAFSGKLAIKSKVGVGTSFVMSLPLSMAIISALLVKIAEETYAIPLNAITEVVQLFPEDIRTIEKKEAIVLRDEVLPLVRLEKRFGAQSINPQSAIPNPQSLISNQQFHTQYILRVESGSKSAGLIIDGFIGRKEIVLKTLPETLKTSRGFAGATILGDGSVVLILDVGYWM